LLPLHYGVFKKDIDKKAIVLAVDVPFKILKIAKDRNISFYPWILQALRAGSYIATNNKFVIIDGQTVQSFASERNVKLVVQNTFQNGIQLINHLAFDDSDFERLCAIANDLGASYLIKAKLIKSETDIKEGNSVPFLLGGSIQFSGKPFAIEMTREVTVEFVVYETLTRKILFTKEFNSRETGKWPNTNNADNRVAKNISSALLSHLSFQKNGNVPKNIIDTTITVGKTVVLGRAKFYQGIAIKGTFIPECEITLISVSTIENKYLRFDFTIWNKTQEKLRVSAKQNIENKFDTYIIDNFNVRYYSISSSLNDSPFQIRAEEKKSFYFVFPVPISTTSSVSFYSTFDFQINNLNQLQTIELKNISIKAKEL
jgi:hypothetical protein